MKTENANLPAKKRLVRMRKMFASSGGILDTGRNKRDRVRSVQNTPCEGQHFNNSFPLLINLFAAAAT